MTSLIFRFATVSGQRVDWQLYRHGPVARPWLWLCVALVAVAVTFWVAGAACAMAFAALSIVLLAVELVRFGRHAADGERISLQGARLVVERKIAGRRERAEFDRNRVRVEPKTADRSLIMLSAQGRSIDVGRFVRPDLRPALASEIRRALRAA